MIYNEKMELENDLKVCVLSSGSKGNCTYIGAGSTNILIDNGMPLSYIEKNLAAIGVKASEIGAILVTHRHSDHTSGIAPFCARYGAEVFVAEGDLEAMLRLGVPYDSIMPFEFKDFYLGAFTISPFRLSHDVPCCGFSVYSGGQKATVATDLGSIGDGLVHSLADSGLLVLESNHDEALLKNSSYSPILKRRIASQSGHLSNADCSQAVTAMAKLGLKRVVLAHLSEENNYPELAFSTLAARLKEEGLTAGKDIKIDIALQGIASPLFRVG